MKTVFLLALLAAATWSETLAGRAPASAKEKANPLAADAEAALAGAKLYRRECTACHGPAREGRGKNPPLTTPWITKAPPGALSWVLRNGSLRHGMPSFAHLPEAERWQIVTFLQRGASPRL